MSLSWQGKEEHRSLVLKEKRRTGEDILLARRGKRPGGWAEQGRERWVGPHGKKKRLAGWAAPGRKGKRPGRER
jgi:hypothetical protein